MAKSSQSDRKHIPPEIEAEMTPSVKAFTLTLLARIEQLEDQLLKLTPQNSSLPPSTRHPHGRPKPKPTSGKKKKQGGQKGHKKHLVTWFLRTNVTT